MGVDLADLVDLAGAIPLSLRNGGHIIPFAPLSACGGGQLLPLPPAPPPMVRMPKMSTTDQQSTPLLNGAVCNGDMD